MKSLPAIISLATAAALLLLAVAASFIDSLPFALIASYIVGFACSVGFLALFIADYGPRSARPIELVIRETEAKRHIERPVAQLFEDPITLNVLSTVGLQNDPATLSFS
jgi:hypothetical protein